MTMYKKHTQHKGYEYRQKVVFICFKLRNSQHLMAMCKEITQEILYDDVVMCIPATQYIKNHIRWVFRAKPSIWAIFEHF